MFGELKSLQIHIYYSDENIETFIIDNVPDDIKSAQLLQKIFPLIKENNTNDRKSSSKFNYVLRINDKILMDTDVVDSMEVDVIPKPEERTFLADFCIIISFLFMVIMPLYHIMQFSNIKAAIQLFIINAFLFSRVINLFPSKTDYNSFNSPFNHAVKNPILEAIIILVKSFHPDFHLEDVLLHD